MITDVICSETRFIKMAVMCDKCGEPKYKLDMNGKIMMVECCIKCDMFVKPMCDCSACMQGYDMVKGYKPSDIKNMMLVNQI